MARVLTRFAAALLTQGKAKLPDLPYAYNALEPAISKEIMQMHHQGHHAAYVTNLNAALKSVTEAQEKSDLPMLAELQRAINFNAGGHINHSLFWENLAPDGGKPPAETTALGKAIKRDFGGFDKLQDAMTKELTGVQGSGWAWLVKDSRTGALAVTSRPNQDPVLAPFVPLLGIDAWEHAYYLQYGNKKADYFKAIFSVLNWGAAEERFG